MQGSEELFLPVFLTGLTVENRTGDRSSEVANRTAIRHVPERRDDAEIRLQRFLSVAAWFTLLSVDGSVAFRKQSCQTRASRRQKEWG